MTNNEFYLWLVKFYIVQEKGEAMNQAKTTISMVRQKAQREEVKVMKNVGSIDFTKLSVGEEFSGVKGVFLWISQLAMKLESIIASV